MDSVGCQGVKDMSFLKEHINDCLFISVFAYDHTIKASANRGKSIKYFKTGLGVGKNLKRLETLIKENNHTHAAIEYLKVLRNLLVIYH